MSSPDSALREHEQQIGLYATKDLGCCAPCALRLSGHRKLSTYDGIKSMGDMLGFIINNENGNAGDGEPAEKKIKTDLESQANGSEEKVQSKSCPSCLDLLQSGISETAQQSIINSIKEQGFIFDEFQLQIFIPVNISLRGAILLAKISQNLRKLTGDEKVSDLKQDSVYSVKEVYRHILIERIQKEFKADFNADASFQILITLDSQDLIKDFEPLREAFPHLFYVGKCHRALKEKQQLNEHNYYNMGSLGRALTEMSRLKTLVDLPLLRSSTGSVPAVTDVRCYNKSVYLAGRYNKYSRTVSQSPWFGEGAEKVDVSVQELIEREVHPLIPHERAKFSASGREDVDVLMLGRGRPFVLELISPKITKIPKNLLSSLALAVNQNCSGKIFIRDVQYCDKDEFMVKLKEGEDLKTKEYRALICISRPLTDQDIATINGTKELVLAQKTPIRVVHRRTVATRSRTIHSMTAKLLTDSKHIEDSKCSKFDPDSNPLTQSLDSYPFGEKELLAGQVFQLDLTTEAGTYIKEFVHGDCGRTRPALGELLDPPAETDIIQLDVLRVNSDWPPASQDQS